MKAYLIRLTAAAILGAVIRRLSPKDGAGKVSRFGAGLLIIFTALGPLGDFDPVSAAQNLVNAGYGQVMTTQETEAASNALLQELIIESARTYILDKAEELGAEITASVETRFSEGYPIPWRVKVEGNISEAQKSSLQKIIESDLGIPEDRQEW